MLYAEADELRRRQQTRDLLVLLAVIATIAIGLSLHASIIALRTPGEVLARAGASVAGAASLGSTVASLPLVGEALGAPFAALTDAGTTLEEAGLAQVTAVEDLARWSSLAVGGLPALALIGLYVPRRLRWARDARGGRMLLDTGASPRIFAERALTTIRLDLLATAVADPAAELAAGRFDGLAALELERLGLVNQP